MNDTFQNLMLEATRLTQTGRLSEATEAIQRALGGAAAARRADSPAVDPLVLDGCVFEVGARTPVAPTTVAADARSGAAPGAEPPAPLRPAQGRAPTAARGGAGEFSSGTHTHASRTRQYKIYVPPGAGGRQLPLVVMLHGCTQDPDDFAAGTGMNERALERGFLVLYPAQSQDANPQRCWNWFKHNHQQRGSGEPALIADMTRSVIGQHGIDARRVYIAGLSAGGAMAAIVAAAYPEIFAAVGVHSGLPRGAASNVSEALMLMNSGVVGPSLPVQGGRVRRGQTAPLPPQKPVPTIVFHGDEDRTVHPRNGEQVIAASHAFAAGSARVDHGVSSHGRRYTRSTHHGEQGNALAEHWLVHGAGHAWSGGRAEGSYTDSKGPDATREMLRFFFEHPQGVRH